MRSWGGERFEAFVTSLYNMVSMTFFWFEFRTLFASDQESVIKDLSKFILDSVL